MSDLYRIRWDAAATIGAPLIVEDKQHGKLGVLAPVTTPLYAVCGRCGGHGETVTDGIGENCCNCGGGGYVPFNSAAVKGEKDV